MSDQKGVQIGKEAIGMTVVSAEQTTNVPFQEHETQPTKAKEKINASSGDETTEKLENRSDIGDDEDETKDGVETIQTKSQNSRDMEKSNVMHTLGLSVTGMVVATMVSVFAIFAMKKRRQRILNLMRLHDKLEDGNTNPGEADKCSHRVFCIIRYLSEFTFVVVYYQLSIFLAFSSVASISSPIHPIDETSKSNNNIENQLVQRSEDHEGKILFIIYSNYYKISNDCILKTVN